MKETLSNSFTWTNNYENKKRKKNRERQNKSATKAGLFFIMEKGASSSIRVGPTTPHFSFSPFYARRWSSEVLRNPWKQAHLFFPLTNLFSLSLSPSSYALTFPIRRPQFTLACSVLHLFQLQKRSFSSEPLVLRNASISEEDFWVIPKSPCLLKGKFITLVVWKRGLTAGFQFFASGFSFRKSRWILGHREIGRQFPTK